LVGDAGEAKETERGVRFGVVIARCENGSGVAGERRGSVRDVAGAENIFEGRGGVDVSKDAFGGVDGGRIESNTVISEAELIVADCNFAAAGVKAEPS
jgi:hypothetical protein